MVKEMTTPDEIELDDSWWYRRHEMMDEIRAKYDDPDYDTSHHNGETSKPSNMTTEVKSEGWVYDGKTSKGESKFRRPTNQTLEHVTKYLDSKELAYFVHEQQALIFIYKEPNPTDRYSPRYAYYYTTGKWGNDKRKKHYHSNGIEHFVETYHRTKEQTRKYWDKFNKENEKAK